MSRIIIQKRSLSHRKSISCEDDSRFQLRALLTTIKQHQTHRPQPIPRSIYHSGYTQDPQQQLNNQKNNEKKNRLPRIATNSNRSNISKLNQFEHHIIHNYLNVHLKIVEGDSVPLKPSKTKRKINKRKNKIKYTTNNHGDSTTFKEAQLQTLNNGSRYESIEHHKSSKKQSKKQYSLKQQPMKHYVHEKLQRKKREWKQNSPLQLLTYFALAYEKAGTKTDHGISKHTTTTQKVDSHIPSKSQLSNFIKHYRPRNSNIKILQMIKKKTFSVDFGEQSLYFGQISEGNRQGLGVQIKSGYIFEGQWKDGNRIKGIEITQYGTYNGLFKNDKKQGKGQFNWPNGQFYSGEWRDGKRDGVGLWTSPKGDSYMGEWKKGVVEGQGVHKTNSGQRYEGSFRNFLKHGFGKQSFPNGDKYEGYYVEGLPNGISTYYWSNGTIYQGNFINGYRTGKGTLTNDKGFSLSGQFLKEKADGPCQIDYGDGDVYNGEMRDGKRNGKGTLRNKAKHRIFDGYWKDNDFASLDEIK